MEGKNEKKKIPVKLKDLYPEDDIVCKINYYNESQGSCVCEDLLYDRQRYSGHIVSSDIKKAIEGSLNPIIGLWKKWGRKTRKIYSKSEPFTE